MIKKSIVLKILVAIVVVVVMIVAGLGFWYSGSPKLERARKIDYQRVNDLMQLAGAIDNYMSTNSKLPTTFDFLKNERYAHAALMDPITYAPYEYHITSPTTYELCATFQTDNLKDNLIQNRPAYLARFGYMRQHSVGKKCFELNVNTRSEKPRPPHL